MLQARVAELADAQDLGSCAARREGSTPSSRIIKLAKGLQNLSGPDILELLVKYLQIFCTSLADIVMACIALGFSGRGLDATHAAADLLSTRSRLTWLGVR